MAKQHFRYSASILKSSHLFIELGLVGLTTGDYRIPIHTIRKVQLAPVTGFRNMAHAIQQSRLSLVTDTRTYRFQPYNFLRKEGPDHRMDFLQAFGKSKARVEALINEAPFIQALCTLAGSDTRLLPPPLQSPWHTT